MNTHSAPAAQGPVIQAPTVPGPVVQAPEVQGPVMQAPAVLGLVVQAPAVQGPVVQAPAVQGPLMQDRALQVEKRGRGRPVGAKTVVRHAKKPDDQREKERRKRQEKMMRQESQAATNEQNAVNPGSVQPPTDPTVASPEADVHGGYLSCPFFPMSHHSCPRFHGITPAQVARSAREAEKEWEKALKEATKAGRPEPSRPLAIFPTTYSWW